eukprot:3107863-Rhodomonas_salina.2
MTGSALGVITSVPFARNPLPSFTRGRTQRREISRTWRVINQIEDDTLHALIYIPWRRSNRAIEKCDSDLCDNDAELFKLIGMESLDVGVLNGSSVCAADRALSNNLWGGHHRIRAPQCHLALIRDAHERLSGYRIDIPSVALSLRVSRCR